MSKPRILLCDDHDLIIAGLRSLLENDFQIAGVASNGRDLVAEALRLRPEVVILDVSMPILNGMEAARQLKSASPAMKLLFVTQRTEREYVHAAFLAGAHGYLVKQSAARELIPALREVLANRFYVSPSLREHAEERIPGLGGNPAHLFSSRLTGRQREVLQLVAEGKSNKEIAGLLGVSIKTVDFHKARIMEELGLRTTAELTRYALAHGLAGA